MNVSSKSAAAKSAITSADIVDALRAIRNDLAGGVRPVFVVPKIWDLIGRIEANADLATEQRMNRLMAELSAQIPPVRGGGHDDDFEELCPEFVEDPQGWPSGWHEELDGYTWEPDFDGPTPDDVLVASAPTWAPSDADWEDMFAMSDASLTEADHLVLHGCV